MISGIVTFALLENGMDGMKGVRLGRKRTELKGIDFLTTVGATCWILVFFFSVSLLAENSCAAQVGADKHEKRTPNGSRCCIRSLSRFTVRPREALLLQAPRSLSPKFHGLVKRTFRQRHFRWPLVSDPLTTFSSCYLVVGGSRVLPKTSACKEQWRLLSG